MTDKTTTYWEIVKFDGNRLTENTEEIASEFPLTIMINGQEFATMVCTPTDIDDLVIGFLASEGIIRFYDEINSVNIDEDTGFVYIELNKALDLEANNTSKRFIGSCCGKSRQFYFKNDVKTAKTILSQLTVTVDQCLQLMETMQSDSSHFHRTGGVHNAALCTSSEIVTTRTDIGRHNALDKIYGHAIKNRIKLKDKLVVFSGRISSEVLLKISKLGVGILISKSAPTDLALKLADDLGITTVGFVRGTKLNVYTHPERISGV